MKKIGVYFYIFPTYSQAKKVIWDSITNTGERFLDYIPAELKTGTNSTEQKIHLANGSLIQLVGSDNIDSLMGTNPQGIIFSEYALQDPAAYQFLRPILLANGGWAMFVSTPRGKNHLWELFNIAQDNDNWFCSKLAVTDTQHISIYEINKEIEEGLISQDLAYQEYYTSFDMGIEGSYYAKYLDKMRVRGQIGIVPYEAGFKVFTSWDLGVRDSTTILFFQNVGTTVRIIDCYENSKVGLEHYVNVLRRYEQEKGYIYGKHIAPHDIAVKEFGSGMTRLEKAKTLGLTFVVAPQLSIEDGIEAVRSCLSKVWIDEIACKQFIKAIENYRQEWDPKRKVYKGHPLHDWSSHWCFTGDTPVLTRNGMRPIMDITSDDEILTLEGWQKCTQAKMTQKNAKLVEVKFSDGTKVKCTPDHLFLTTNGWKSAEKLTKNTKILSSLTNSLSILMAHCIDYGQMRSTFLRVDKDSIERYGKKLTEQYLKIATYITKTMIPLTTISGISNAYKTESILNFLDQITEDLQILLGARQPSGIDRKQEDYGINDLLKELKDGRNGSAEQAYAFIVNQSLKHLYAEMGMDKNFATRTAKHLIIGSVNFLKERADVWDIGVPYNSQFSLSNGAIVHNCDNLRYLAVSLPKTRDTQSAETLEDNYRKARYGTDFDVPAPFRQPNRY